MFWGIGASLMHGVEAKNMNEVIARFASVHLQNRGVQVRGLLQARCDSRFARLDTLVYSPLCLPLAMSVTLVAWRPGI
jgi:hypothetical protein